MAICMEQGSTDYHLAETSEGSAFSLPGLATGWESWPGLGIRVRCEHLGIVLGMELEEQKRTLGPGKQKKPNTIFQGTRNN
jgi:hypothetical protein